MDETLKPDDAVEIFEELLPAQHKSYMLGVVLNLPPHKVEFIHSCYQDPKKCIRHVIIEFLKQWEPRPTWRNIIKALRDPTVDLPDLAMRVEAAHIPDPTATCDVVPETTVKHTLQSTVHA